MYTLLVRSGMSTEPPASWVANVPSRLSQTRRTGERYVDVISLLTALRESGSTLAVIASHLNEQGFRTHRGLRWNAASLNNLQQRQGTLLRDGSAGG